MSTPRAEWDPGESVFRTPLKRTGRVALYRQIADRLRAAIVHGERRLPTERELAQGFTVARVTVRAALDLLAADDLISRRRRHGTAVRDEVFENPARRAAALEG
jgi:DNA-binding GntR family transcriptional regulator